jgi:hypothetical protein
MKRNDSMILPPLLFRLVYIYIYIYIYYTFPKIILLTISQFTYLIRNSLKFHLQVAMYISQQKNKQTPGYKSAGKLYPLRQPLKSMPNFAGSVRCMVSATEPYGRSSWFCRPEPLLFHSSSSSIILRSPSGPRSRATTPQKIYYRLGIELGISRLELWPLDHEAV